MRTKAMAAVVRPQLDYLKIAAISAALIGSWAVAYALGRALLATI